MPRQKSPEETVTRILDVSLDLFLRKGYDNTSIQDILDALGDLSKGAIYHHFKSKEDILVAVMDRLTAQQGDDWDEILHGEDAGTGAERIQDIFFSSVSGPGQEEFFRTSPNLLNNPRLLAMQMKSIMEESAPQYIQPLVERGVADGSIHTGYPREMAEVILLLVNVWMTPMVFPASREVLERRTEFFDELFRGTGLQLFGGEVGEHIRRLYDAFAGHMELEW